MEEEKNKLVYQYFDDKLVMPNQPPNWQFFFLIFQFWFVKSTKTLNFNDEICGKINISMMLQILKNNNKFSFSKNSDVKKLHFYERIWYLS